MSGAQGLGQSVGQGSMPQQSQMSGGLGNQYQMTPPQGMPLPNTDMPQSVQRMPGGFGLSPQLLQMIAQLQARTPRFSPQQPPAQQQFGGRPPIGFNMARNPYQSQSGIGGPGTGWGH